MGHRKRSSARVAAVDLFCGAGGLTHGLMRVGIPVVAGVDIDAACKHPFEENNAPAKFIHADVGGLTGLRAGRLYPRDALKVLAGCAPCQPFSFMGQQKRNSDDKWRLLDEFGRLISEVHPEIVTMENVPALQRQVVYEQFVGTLENEGYDWSAAVVYCPDFGVPQERRRLVLLASRLGSINLVPATRTPSKYPTVRDAIAGLEEIEAGEQSDDDPMHYAANLSAVNRKRLASSAPGGSWEDWPPELQLKCHKGPKARSFRSVYGRMEWNKPGPVVTTKSFNLGSGRFGHPDQLRALSLREMALLQTFPKDYSFTDSDQDVSLTEAGILIGNAVPVRLGEAVGASIRRHLQSVRPDIKLASVRSPWRRAVRSPGTYSRRRRA